MLVPFYSSKSGISNDKDLLQYVHFYKDYKQLKLDWVCRTQSIVSMTKQMECRSKVKNICFSPLCVRYLSFHFFYLDPDSDLSRCIRVFRFVQKVSQDIHGIDTLRFSKGLQRFRRDNGSERRVGRARERNNLSVGVNKSVVLDQPERGENFINASAREAGSSSGKKSRSLIENRATNEIGKFYREIG